MPEFLKFEGGRLVRTATQQGDTHLCGSHAKPGDGDDSVERYTLPREAFSSAHADYLEWKKKHPTKRFEGFNFSYCCYHKMAIRQSDFDLAAPYLRSFKVSRSPFDGSYLISLVLTCWTTVAAQPNTHARVRLHRTWGVG